MLIQKENGEPGVSNAYVCCRQQQDQQWQDQMKRMGAGAAGKRPWPGCTALAVLLKDDVMVVANAGAQISNTSALSRRHCVVAHPCRPDLPPHRRHLSLTYMSKSENTAFCMSVVSTPCSVCS